MAAAQEETPLVFHALQEPLQQALEETPAEPVANEELSWRTFATVVVYYFVVGIESGRLLLTHLRHASPELGLPTSLKKSTFFEGFRRFSPSLALQLFSSLLARLSFFPVPEMAALGRLCAVDGSYWPALFRMHWAVAGPNKPTVLLHLAFNLNQMIPVSMLLTESTGSERKALKQMLQAGVTYVADRGYFAFYLLLDIATAGAFFVIRAPRTVTYEILEVLPVVLPAGVNWLCDVQDLKVYCDKEGSCEIWRVVRFCIGDSEFTLFSNRWDLTTWQIITIYAYRWQIELLFLFVKRTLNGLHLLTHCHKGLQIQFYLMLSAALLLLNFKQRNEQAVGNQPDKGEAQQQPQPAGRQDEASESASKGEAVQAQAKPEPAPGQATSQIPQGQPDETAQAQATAQLEATARPAQIQTPQVQPEGAARQGASETPQEQPTAQAKRADRPAAKQTARQRQQPGQNSQKQTQQTGGAKQARAGTVQPGDNSKWYQSLGAKLGKFWRISKHWLEVLREKLARPWNPADFQVLPGAP